MCASMQIRDVKGVCPSYLRFGVDVVMLDSLLGVVVWEQLTQPAASAGGIGNKHAY